MLGLIVQGQLATRFLRMRRQQVAQHRDRLTQPVWNASVPPYPSLIPFTYLTL